MLNKKRGRGRPAINPALGVSPSVQVRIPQDIRDDVQRACAGYGITLAVAIRWALVQWLKAGAPAPNAKVNN